MTDRLPDLEERVEQLTSRVEALTLTVEKLAAQIQAGPLSRPLDANGASTAMHASRPGGPAEAGPVSDEIITWAGRASLLPRLATLCFLLVVALGLRTITEYSPAFSRTGTIIGIVYAASLIAIGWGLYGRSRPLAPVFAVTGAILMSVIEVEAELRFHALSATPAYALLIVTGGGMALMSRRFDRFLPISVGVLGMCLASVWIDWPEPFFPGLALVLLTANLLGWFASRIQRCSWLRWTVLVVSTLMLYFLWGYKLVFLMERGQLPTPRLAVPFLLPTLALFAIVYMGMALLGIVRRGAERASLFDLSLPVINVVWAFFACSKIVSALRGDLLVLGAVGVAASLLHLAAAAWLARRRALGPGGRQGEPSERTGSRGTTSFALAGVALLAMALPLLTGNLLIALPVLSATAFALAVTARAWRSRGVLWISTLLQIAASLALSIHLRSNARFAASAASAAAAAAPACIGFLHYRWLGARRRGSEGEQGMADVVFAGGGASSMILLTASLLGAFFMLRVGIWQALSRLPVDIKNSFPCAQSILINVSAAVLMLIALARRDREVRNVAILVTVIGGLKVFPYDLIGTHGIPLTASVFTFGVVAAIESVALSRWTRPPETKSAPAIPPAEHALPPSS